MEAVDTRAKPSREVLSKAFILIFPLVKKKTFSMEYAF